VITIPLIVYDFDGVLTDNRVWVNQDGVESVRCNRSDGWWIQQISQMGIEQIILSTEKNPVVSQRARKLKIESVQGVPDKRLALEEICRERGITPNEIIYVGNEMNDFGCFQIAGHTFAPQDSHPQILSLAKHPIPVDGGEGIVRFIYDWLQNG